MSFNFYALVDDNLFLLVLIGFVLRSLLKEIRTTEYNEVVSYLFVYLHEICVKIFLIFQSFLLASSIKEKEKST